MAKKTGVDSLKLGTAYGAQWAYSDPELPDFYYIFNMPWEYLNDFDFCRGIHRGFDTAKILLVLRKKLGRGDDWVPQNDEEAAAFDELAAKYQAKKERYVARTLGAIEGLSFASSEDSSHGSSWGIKQAIAKIEQDTNPLIHKVIEDEKLIFLFRRSFRKAYSEALGDQRGSTF